MLIFEWSVDPYVIDTKSTQEEVTILRNICDSLGIRLHPADHRHCQHIIAYAEIKPVKIELLKSILSILLSIGIEIYVFKGPTMTAPTNATKWTGEHDDPN